MMQLPAPPADHASQDCESTGPGLAKPTLRTIEPVGEGFFARSRREFHGRSLAEDDVIEGLLLGDESLVEDDARFDGDEPAWLLKSDPLKWKQLDHYLVMGLSTLRFKATDDDIKQAYRRKVLKHHPDKLKGKANSAPKPGKRARKEDDSFFKCIQKSWELLGDPVKRRQFDSCDPTFDDSLPSVKKDTPTETLFRLLDEAFENNARFSKKPNLPRIGNLDTPRKDVETFYEAWYNFNSWRTFEYMDEEDTDKSDSREEKRYLDRQNKAMRTKRKAEDNKRITLLVELATKNDPRLSKFKEEDRFAKDAKKRERNASQRQAEEEARVKAEAEKIIADKIEAESKAQAVVDKAKNKKLKEVLKKEKRAIRKIMEEDKYFLLSESPSMSDIDGQVIKMTNLLESLSELSSFERLRQCLLSASDRAGRSHVLNTYSATGEPPVMEQAKAATPAPAAAEKAVVQAANWLPKEMQILIKAVKLLPGGTLQRWEKIADYVNAHGGEDNETAAQKSARQRKADDCIKMSKEFGRGGADEKSYIASASQAKIPVFEIKDAPTQRFDVEKETSAAVRTPPPSKSTTPAPASASAAASSAPTPAATPASAVDSTSAADSPWSAIQQAQLEAALKLYPAGDFKETPADRWDQISSSIDGKTTKDVKKRVKELAELVKKKKETSTTA